MRDADIRASRRFTRFGFEDSPFRRTRIPIASGDGGGTLLRSTGWPYDGSTVRDLCAQSSKVPAQIHATLTGWP
jgi:hypothetical protein